MAINSSFWTPERTSRLHSGIGFLLLAAVLAAVSMTLGLLSSAIFGGRFFSFVQTIVAWIAVGGLAQLRSVTRDMVRATEPAGKTTTRPAARPVSPSSVVRARVQPAATELRVAAVGRTESLKPVERATAKKPSTPSMEWEAWIGQKLLQKVGVIIVLIGMLVFLQQAFENRWIDELGRVFLALVGAGLLLGAGEFFQKKYAQWSQAFTGGGLALAYLAVWVAHVLYRQELLMNYGFDIPASIAFTLYGIITLVGVLLSVRYRAQIVAWFAVAGGYLTPLLVDAAAPNPLVLTGYLGILGAGLLLLTGFRHWKGIALASFLLTQYLLSVGVYPVLSVTNAQQIWIAIGSFVLFSILPLVRHFRLREHSTPEELALIVLNAFAVYMPIQQALGGWQSEWVTLLILGLASFAIVCAAIAVRLRGDDRVLGDTYLLGALALIALALYHQLGWHWLALGWAPLAALTAYLGLSLGRRSVWSASMLLLVGAMTALVTNVPVFTETESSWRPFLGNWSIQSYVVFASLLGLLPAIHRAPASFTKGVDMETPMHALMALIAFAVLTFEVTALHWEVTRTLALSYLVFAAVATLAFVWIRQIVWFITALVLQVLVAMLIFFRGDGVGMDAFTLFDVSRSVSAVPLFDPWAFVSLFGLITFYGLYTAVTRSKEHPLLPRVRTSTLILAMIIAQVWLHGSVEVRHAADAFAWSTLVFQRVLSLWWLAVAAPMVVIGRSAGWRKASILLLALPFFKDIFNILQDTGTLADTVAWTLVTLGVAVYGVQSQKRELLRAGVTGLVLCTTADMLTHAGEIDTGMLRSVWWAIAGLLTIVAGFHLKTKLLRQTAIGIFAATVVKLLLVDFSVLDTPVRIVASIATGLLLIGASYLYQRFGTSQTDR